MPSDIKRQVRGIFVTPAGEPVTNKTLTFFRSRRVVTPAGDSTVVDEPFFATTDGTGLLDKEMLAGNYMVMVKLSDVDRYFNMAVPDEPGPHNPVDLLDYADPGDPVLTQVQQLVLKARAWAENPEDVEVDPTGYPGEYSAKHYSKKAAAARDALNTQFFDSRAEAVTAIAAGDLDDLAGNAKIWVGVLAWFKLPIGHVLYGTNPIGDMPGFGPEGSLSLDHWGAPKDGVGDASPAVQEAFDYIGAFNMKARLRVPAGTYRMFTQAHLVMSGAATSENDFANGITLEGEGRQVTNFIADQSNSDGCIKIETLYARPCIFVLDMSILSPLKQDTEFAQNNGTGLWITAPNPPIDGSYTRRRQIYIVRVEVKGSGAPNEFVGRGIWEYGIRIDYLSNPTLIDCWIEGCSNDAPYSNAKTAANFKAGLYCVMSYDLWMRDCNVADYFQKSVYWHGTRTEKDSFEGGFFIGNAFVGGLDGLVISHDFNTGGYIRGESGGLIWNNHINARRFSIVINNMADTQIKANYFIMPGESRNDTGEPVTAAIYLPNANRVDIAENIFSGSADFGWYNSDTDCSAAILIGPGDPARSLHNFEITVGENSFYSGGVFLYNQSEGGNISSVNNRFTDGTETAINQQVVKYVDQTGVVYINDFDSSATAGQPFDGKYISTPRLGSPAYKEEIHNPRSDYATTSAPVIKRQSVFGRDSAGNEEEVVRIDYGYVTNADGSEDGVLRVLVNKNGAMVEVANFSGQRGANVPSGQVYRVGNQQVVGARRTGWNAPTGALTRGTFDSATATTADVAEALAALIADLRVHGLIGT